MLHMLDAEPDLTQVFSKTSPLLSSPPLSSPALTLKGKVSFFMLSLSKNSVAESPGNNEGYKCFCSHLHLFKCTRVLGLRAILTFLQNVQCNRFT